MFHNLGQNRFHVNCEWVVLYHPWQPHCYTLSAHVMKRKLNDSTIKLVLWSFIFPCKFKNMYKNISMYFVVWDPPPPSLPSGCATSWPADANKIQLLQHQILWDSNFLQNSPRNYIWVGRTLLLLTTLWRLLPKGLKCSKIELAWDFKYQKSLPDSSTVWAVLSCFWPPPPKAGCQ